MRIRNLLNLDDINLPEVNDLTQRLYQNRIHNTFTAGFLDKKCQLFEFY